MSHRGPDGRGSEFYQTNGHFIGLGHNRLSIIDLSNNASQPMTSENGTVISFNGEIYNFKELREALASEGTTFSTSSDTEVILKIYEKYGVEGFNYLRGMFAFVIYDLSIEKIYIVRDHVGIKPIYIYDNNGEIFCASEIKGLKAFDPIDPRVDKNEVFEFFNHGFLYEPDTGFENIKKLEPSSFLEIDLNSGVRLLRKYKPNFQDIECHSYSSLISNSLSQQTFADVKVGTFFSGGTDSSVIAALQDSEDLLFAKYEKDERTEIDVKFSKKISNYLNKNLLIEDLSSSDKTSDQVIQDIDFVAENSEELISDFTFFPSYRLASKARELGYTVMLSGMGGDEAFCGYPRYIITKFHFLFVTIYPILKFFIKFNLYPKRLNKRIDRLISYLEEKDWEIAYSRLLGFYSSRELEGLFNEFESFHARLANKLAYLNTSTDNSKVKQAQVLDSKGFLCHNLMVSDKSSMLASIEVRVPLLNEETYRKGLLARPSSLIKYLKLKKPLKDLLQEIIPASLVKRPKTGFNPPLDEIINKLGSEIFEDNLNYVKNFIDITFAKILISDHFSGKKNNTYKLWQLIYFCRWIKANG